MPSEALQMERISPTMRLTDDDESGCSGTDDHWQSPHDSRHHHHHHTSPHSMVSTAEENSSSEQLLNLTTSHKRTSSDAELESRLHSTVPEELPHDADINISASTATHAPRGRTQSRTDRSDSASDVDEKPEMARTIKFPISSHYQAMLLSSSASVLRSQIPFPFFPVNQIQPQQQQQQHPVSGNVRPNSFAHSNYFYPQFNPTHAALAGVAATPGSTPVGLHQQTSFPSFIYPPGFGIPPMIDSSLMQATSKRRRIPTHLSKTDYPDFDSSSLSQGSTPQPSTSSGLPVGLFQGRDEAYAERRRKNNEAAKRSRDLRRIKEQETALHARQLYEENIRLKVELQYLAQQLTLLRNGYAGR